ncbi:MAG: tRNA 2-thiocytidine biosynthesis protein TtcA [Clostridiales bacterium]|nr:tRNA 2-thiocytidine biosynthesis protein TtcA [Clostridiales bacterium]
MIKNGDSICVGVSGGKDSLLLMYGLKLYQRFCKKDYKLKAVMLDLGLVEQNIDGIYEYAKDIGVDFESVKTDIGDVVFNIRKEKNPCALCAKLRRGALNSIANDLGCNLVALGHNREDVIETFFLSLLYESRLSTFGPVTYMTRKEVTLIRPLIFLPEKYAIGIAKKLELPVQPKNCPVGGKTKREEMKSFIKHLCIDFVPDADTRIMKAISDTHK